MDSGEKRLNELGYKQELRREMVLLPPSGSYLYAISRPLPLSLFRFLSSLSLSLLLLGSRDLDARNVTYANPSVCACCTADAVQDAGHLLLHHDALHGDHAAVREQPAVRGAGAARLGLGRRLLLHLLRRRRHGRDLLLLPGTPPALLSPRFYRLLWLLVGWPASFPFQRIQCRVIGHDHLRAFVFFYCCHVKQGYLFIIPYLTYLL